MGRFSILILTIGIPGSGKSTWTKEYQKQHPLTYIVSTDAIREELMGTRRVDDASKSPMIHEEARKRVKQILDDPNSQGGLGPEIIVDSTNVDVEEWAAYRKLNPSIMLAKVFDISVSEAMERQNERGFIVPQEVVQWKYDSLQKYKPYMQFFFNMIL